MSTESLTIDQLVDYYIRLRDKRDALKKKHAEELRPITTAMSEVEVRVLDYLQKQGAESTRTSHGTCYRSTRTSYSLSDAASFRDWCEAEGRFDLMESRVSKSALEDFMQDGGTLPPGVKVSSEVVVGFRRS